MLNKIEDAMSFEIKDNGQMVKLIIEQIGVYLRNQTNIALERLKLVKRKQGENENFDSFYTSLCYQAKYAGRREMKIEDWMSCSF
uniref:Uncharacterized protein n=1 Tax=Lepeophtheirus salmonis TaxID=72036 RepID=A0A0K2U3B0_LEPSM